METVYHRIVGRIMDPQVAALIFFFLTVVSVLFLLDTARAPILSALVIAYVMEGAIQALRKQKMWRMVAFGIVYSLFVLLIIVSLLVLLPYLVQQLNSLLGEIPKITITVKEIIQQFSVLVAGVAHPQFVQEILVRLSETTQDFTTNTITLLLKGIPGILTVLIYFFLVPFFVFFLLKDKDTLLAGVIHYLPKDRDLLLKVMKDAHVGLGGYIRGKFLEMLIVGAFTYLAFQLLHAPYALLLGLLSGISVFIPYVGVVVVTIPVVVLAIFQWGMTWEAMNLLIVFAVIQMIDGIFLQPLILGEAIKVNPAFILLALLVFGAYWGVLGVFFAVPLLVLVKSIQNAMPRGEQQAMNGMLS